MKRLFAAVLALLLSFPAVADQSSYQIPLTGPKAFGGTGGVADEISHAFLATVGCSSGGSAPANGPSSAAILGQCWLNNSSNPNQVQIFDGSQWTNFFQVDTSAHVVNLSINGKVIVGGTSNLFSGLVEVDNANGSAATGTINVTQWNGSRAALALNRSGSGSIGSHALIGSGLNTGAINYQGDDGTTFQTGAQIAAATEGTPAAGQVPSRLFLSTMTQAGVLTEALRVDSSQRITIGGVANQVGAAFEINGTNNNANTLEVISWGSTSNPRIDARRSDSGVIGSHTALLAGDNMLQLRAFGSDGTQFIVGGSITITPDANFSTNNAPTRMVFSTNPGAVSTERLRIDSVGHSLFTAGSPNPASGINSFAITGTGGFGGGIGFLDTGAIGLWSNTSGANLSIGFASSGSAALATIAQFSNSTSNNAAALSLNPTSSSLALGLNITQTADGSPSAANYFGASGTGYALNNITISSDDLVILASAPTIGIGYGWAINHNFGGSNMRGARSAVGISANLTATSSASNQDREYVGSTTYATTIVNDTGTNTGAGSAGAIFAENPFACLCSASATNYFSMSGAEVDISNRGGTVKYKFGWRIVLDAGDNGQGVSIDAAYSVGAGGGAGTGWKQAYGLDDLGGNNSPVGTSGCVLCENFNFGPYTIATGIDLLGFTISGNAFRSTNFQLNGTGDLSALSFSVTGGSAGLTCSGTPTASFATQKGIVTHC